MIRYRSFCSGIEAASAAWKPLGWQCLSVSEIDAQASAVLAHHYPNVPNLGDVAASKEAICNEYADLFVAGTPCQSFSVAGLRKGMADPRGNLALVFLGLVDAARPRWIVWENVPGVLSSGGGRDFGSFLGALAELGYGWSYRVLDAQYVRVESHARAVPQRRRRVFVVGHLGSWQRAAAVLSERQGLCGNTPPRREAGQGVATALTRGLGSGGADDNRAQGNWYVPDISPAMKARDCKGPSSDGDGDGLPLVAATLSSGAPIGSNQAGRRREDDVNLVAHTLKGEGHDASEDGTGRGVPLVTSIQCNGGDIGLDLPSLRRGNGAFTGGVPAVAFQTRIARNGRGQPKDVTDALTSCDGGTHADSKPHVAYGSTVRRLLPVECERLMGFPDNYTAIPYRGKPMADAPRYRMLGNSMAVNVMRWIGERIALVDELAPLTGAAA